MATRFYNSKENNNITREKFFQDIAALLNGEETQFSADLLSEAVAYELESLEKTRERAKTKNADKPKKDRLESEYAKLVLKHVMPLLGTKAQPKTCTQLAAELLAKGVTNPNTGKPIGHVWVAQILNIAPGVIKEENVVLDIVTKEGLKKQDFFTVYYKG